MSKERQHASERQALQRVATHRGSGIAELVEPRQSVNALTADNLGLHTRVHPPCAADTVSKYLLGLRTPLDDEADLCGGQDAGIQPKSDKDSSKPKKRVNEDCKGGLHGSGQFQQPLQAAVRTNRSPKEPRLISSMKSKKDAVQEEVTPLYEPDSRPAGPPISERRQPRASKPNRRPPLQTKVVANEQASSRARHKSAVAAQELASESSSRQEIGSTMPPSKSPHKRRGRASERVQSGAQTSGIKDGGTREERQRAQLLEQRREKRRAKAVITKDRTKVTGPSEQVLRGKPAKGGKEERRPPPPSSESSSRSVRAARKPLPSDTSSSASGANCNFEKTRQDRFEERRNSKRQRKNDTERSVKMMRESKHNHDLQGGRKSERREPLERAANILPSGRVTLKARTGIYNHGRASHKHRTAVRSTNLLPDLAFNELPFLNGDADPGNRQNEFRPRAVPSQPAEGKSKNRVLLDEGSLYDDDYQPKESSHAPPKKNNPRNERRSDAQAHAASIDAQGQTKVRTRTSVYRNVSARDATLSDSAQSPDIRGQNLHRPQGISFESREAASVSQQPSLQRSIRTSAVGSASVTDGAAALSSLTGLSAASLARRRRLVRERTAPSALSSQIQPDNEMVFFASGNKQASLAVGPTARYGAAIVPSRPRELEYPSPLPELRQLSYSNDARHDDPDVNMVSPDWFGGCASSLSQPGSSAPVPMQYREPQPMSHYRAGSYRLADAPFSQQNWSTLLEPQSYHDDYVATNECYPSMAYRSQCGGSMDMLEQQANEAQQPTYYAQQHRAANYYVQPQGYDVPFDPWKAGNSCLQEAYDVFGGTPSTFNHASQHSEGQDADYPIESAALASASGEPNRPSSRPLHVWEASRFQQGLADLQNFRPRSASPFRAAQSFTGFWQRRPF